MAAISQGTPLILEPKGEHKATVIFLHSFREKADRWIEVFGSLITLDGVKVICPQSAERALTYNNRQLMAAWFDVRGLVGIDEDTDGIREASRYVHSVIDAEIAAGTPSNKIVIGGFSIGGVVAMYSGLTYPQTLGGIIGLSSYLTMNNEFPGNYTANLSTKIFLGQGEMDMFSPPRASTESKISLARFNRNVELHMYDELGHTWCPEEIQDVAIFITTCVL